MLEHISSLVSTFLLGKAVLPRGRSERSFHHRSARGLSIANIRADSRSASTGCPSTLGPIRGGHCRLWTAEVHCPPSACTHRRDKDWASWRAACLMS